MFILAGEIFYLLNPTTHPGTQSTDLPAPGAETVQFGRFDLAKERRVDNTCSTSIVLQEQGVRSVGVG
ncbi:hypothetical protein OIU78_001434 [Salix suchowensis]|nr:hypothetical protein OIU78_001434 [Salix suchowensis]